MQEQKNEQAARGASSSPSQVRGNDDEAAARRSGGYVLSGLSGRMLVLTIIFVMIAEVLIFVPSIARFRHTYLLQRLSEAHLATLTLLAMPDVKLPRRKESELLAQIGVRGIVLNRPQSRVLMLSEEMPPSVSASYDLRQGTPFTLIRDAFVALMHGDGRILRVIGQVDGAEDTVVEVIMDEQPLREAMITYAVNILGLSIVISLITAFFLYIAIRWLLIRPMQRLTSAMMAFRDDPLNARNLIEPSLRRDELGMAERELASMQRQVVSSLRQKSRLADLGAAVSKVNHDLRNILATAHLLSDRLTEAEDPMVRRVAPGLIQAIDRAIALCQRTLKYGKADEPTPVRSFFSLRDLVAEVGEAAGGGGQSGRQWFNQVHEGLLINADRDQLFRVLLNLGRNALEAVDGNGRVVVTAERSEDGVAIQVTDTGPGLPTEVREHLFEPFVGSSRQGGTGLGLAIAHDLVHSHGGSLSLVSSGAQGTVFRIWIPD